MRDVWYGRVEIDNAELQVSNWLEQKILFQFLIVLLIAGIHAICVGEDGEWPCAHAVLLQVRFHNVSIRNAAADRQRHNTRRRPASHHPSRRGQWQHQQLQHDHRRAVSLQSRRSCFDLLWSWRWYVGFLWVFYAICMHRFVGFLIRCCHTNLAIVHYVSKYVTKHSQAIVNETGIAEAAAIARARQRALDANGQPIGTNYAMSAMLSLAHQISSATEISAVAAAFTLRAVGLVRAFRIRNAQSLTTNTLTHSIRFSLNLKTTGFSVSMARH